jgi:hypothetical protein
LAQVGIDPLAPVVAGECANQTAGKTGCKCNAKTTILTANLYLKTL